MIVQKVASSSSNANTAAAKTQAATTLSCSPPVFVENSDDDFIFRNSFVDDSDTSTSNNVQTTINDDDEAPTNVPNPVPLVETVNDPHADVSDISDTNDDFDDADLANAEDKTSKQTYSWKWTKDSRPDNPIKERETLGVAGFDFEKRMYDDTFAADVFFHLWPGHTRTQLRNMNRWIKTANPPIL